MNLLNSLFGPPSKERSATSSAPAIPLNGQRVSPEKIIKGEHIDSFNAPHTPMDAVVALVTEIEQADLAKQYEQNRNSQEAPTKKSLLVRSERSTVLPEYTATRTFIKK